MSPLQRPLNLRGRRTWHWALLLSSLVLAVVGLAVAVSSTTESQSDGGTQDQTPIADPSRERELGSAEERGGSQPSAGGSDVAHGVEIGAHNTGVRLADSQLEPVSGYVTRRDGETVEGLLAHGGIQVRHRDVTIRDVKIVNPNGFYSLWIAHNEQERARGAVVEHVTIDGRGNADRIGVLMGNATMRRLHVMGHATGVRLQPGDRLIESYIEEQTLKPGSHNTAASFHGGSNLQVLRNNLVGTTSSALSLYSNFAPITDVLVQDNLFNGGSYCTYGGGGKVDRFALQNERIRYVGNAFGRLVHENCGIHGPVAVWDGERAGNEWRDNAWQDTGQAIDR